MVDLTLVLYVAKERRNYEAVPETPLPQPAGGPARVRAPPSVAPGSKGPGPYGRRAAGNRPEGIRPSNTATGLHAVSD